MQCALEKCKGNTKVAIYSGKNKHPQKFESKGITGKHVVDKFGLMFKNYRICCSKCGKLLKKNKDEV